MVRVLGSGHSFNAMCDSSETLVSLAYMRNVIEVDPDEMTVSCEGGTTYGDLVKYLAPRGVALRNLASLPHVSIAGAIGTGTHGSGKEFGNLLQQIAEIEFVTHDGEL